MSEARSASPPAIPRTAASPTIDSQQPLQFRDGGSWCDLPPWVAYLLDLGFSWLDDEPRKRRICLVSMPCESPAAGLIALGAVRRRLAVPGADDCAEHFRRIERLAAQPDPRLLLKRVGKHGRYVIDGRYDGRLIWVRKTDCPLKTREAVTLNDSVRWYFEGETPLQVHSGGALAHLKIYQELAPRVSTVILANLQHSDSAICLATSTLGEHSTRNRLRQLWFRAEEDQATADCLLAIAGWSDSRVSRATCLNVRTGRLDRGEGRIRLVVADGPQAFVKVLDDSRFAASDVIGVMHRCVERDVLVMIADKQAELALRYLNGQGCCVVPAHAPPRGIVLNEWRHGA